MNSSFQRRAGIIGARSPVGRHVVRLLEADGWLVERYSRRDIAEHREPTSNEPQQVIENWIYIAHIWTVPENFAFISSLGARRLVAISSTSRFTKTTSSVSDERELAERLARSESRVQELAEHSGIACTILRPTLIYGGGDDRNLSEIAAFIRKFQVFPLLGSAQGLRQPIHVEDVATACVKALARNGLEAAYNISGAEVLTYREMVAHVFRALGRQPRFVSLPRPVVRNCIRLARIIPRFRSVSLGMADRMENDMVFDHAESTRDFGFSPRRFNLTARDVLPADHPLRTEQR